MNYLLAAFRLIRLPNCLMVGVAVLLGAYLQTLTPQKPDIYLIALAAMFLCAAGNSLNDSLDIAPDRINHPERPLPSGDLSSASANIITLIFSLLSLICSIALPFRGMVMIMAMLVALVWYNYYLKRIPIVGNLIVALLGAVTVVAGALVAGGTIWKLPGAWLPSALAFFLHFAREMTKDMQDTDGDRQAGYATMPITAGSKVTLNLAAVSIGMMTLLSLAPVYLNWYGKTYTYLVILTVDIPLLVVLYKLYRNQSESSIRVANTIFKLGLGFGLLAIYMGGAMN